MPQMQQKMGLKDLAKNAFRLTMSIVKKKLKGKKKVKKPTQPGAVDDNAMKRVKNYNMTIKKMAK
jgi:hypothetical protein